MFVPCRKCVVCIKRYVNEWTIRLIDEAEHSDGICLFLTLTYENEPLNYSKEHCNEYIKSLRNSFRTNSFRYFLVGERGTLGSRRHYHMLLFTDIQAEIYSPLIDLVERKWRHGFSKIAAISPKACAYVAKYITPINGGDKFMLMSRGLGRKRITSQMVGSYDRKPRHYFVQNGYKKPLPRYYKSKLKEHAIVFPTYNQELVEKQYADFDRYLDEWDEYDTKQFSKGKSSYRVQQQEIATQTFLKELSEKKRSTL